MKNRFGRHVAILSVAAIWMLASCQLSSHIDNKLTASDAQAKDQFGWSVAISGSIVIVGAVGSDLDDGAAYIFQMESGQWVEKQKLTASDEDMEDHFGCSVAISGDVAIVGANQEDGGAGDPLRDAGAAYIFQLESGQWVEKKKLTASDAQAGDWFGISVAISGDVAIVGANQENGGAGNLKSKAGAVYVFHLESGQWLEKQKLTASDSQAGDYFGTSVAIDGNVAIVGADSEDGGAGDLLRDAGAAYIFQLESGQWAEKKKLTASDAQADDIFGASVAISGDVAIVGAWLEDGDVGAPVYQAGAAYVFQLESGQWLEKQKLTNSDAQADAHFGDSVAIDGDAAIVGARDEDCPDINAGAAYIFQLELGQWVQKRKLTASNKEPSDYFGHSVATSGDVAIVGAPSFFGSGVAYIYELSSL